MYVGRIVGAGRNQSGKLAAAYRISRRSFPNRSAERTGTSVNIVVRPGSADAMSDSPYIAYECLIWSERFSVVSNGTHTRPMYERLKAGNSPRDAIVGVLVGLDREFDQHDTPRICGLIDLAEDKLWLGSVTANSVAVMPVEVTDGQMAYITTYEYPLPHSTQTDIAFNAADAGEVCRHVIGGSVFSGFERPICAAACVNTGSGFEIAVLDTEA
ncbi:IMP cyclohydrolase [Rhizobium sp. 1399]|uniref:IMP cyclohydrolase n=1 Tax=Rhizobium sp. 1399 TaxID=2817758 RepID=UPI00286A5D87|nr:IMP cyclohydrolase [Rhizobium sp. 1399]